MSLAFLGFSLKDLQIGANIGGVVCRQGAVERTTEQKAFLEIALKRVFVGDAKVSVSLCLLLYYLQERSFSF